MQAIRQQVPTSGGQPSTAAPIGARGRTEHGQNQDDEKQITDFENHPKRPSRF